MITIIDSSINKSEVTAHGTLQDERDTVTGRTGAVPVSAPTYLRRKVYAILLAREITVQSVSVADTPPSQRVQFILGEDADSFTLETHPLFTEMEELVRNETGLEWKETARYQVYSY